MFGEGPAGITASYFHTAVVVPDLERGMAELSRATGAEWLPPQERPDDQDVIRVTFSQTPPMASILRGVEVPDFGGDTM